LINTLILCIPQYQCFFWFSKILPFPFTPFPLKAGFSFSQAAGNIPASPFGIIIDKIFMTAPTQKAVLLNLFSIIKLLSAPLYSWPHFALFLAALFVRSGSRRSR